MNRSLRLTALVVRASWIAALIAGCDSIPPAALPVDSAQPPVVDTNTDATADATQPADSVPTVSGGETEPSDTAPDAVGIAQVDPPSAGPGQVVRVVTLGETNVSVPDGGTILIGGLAATIVSNEKPAEFKVMVPVLEPGVVTVQLAENGKPFGETGRLEILPAVAQRLLMTVEDGKVGLLQASTSAGGFHEGAQEDEFRLAYDVCNPEGGLVYSGAIVHPVKGRHEIYDMHDDGHRLLRRMSGPASAVFALKIPNLPQGGAVKFYEVEAGVDLDTREGRAVRRFLNEVKISR